MNPFSLLPEFRNIRTTSYENKLITISSKPAHGKTKSINSLIIKYLKSKVNVLLFTENPKQSLELKKFENRDTGLLLICSLGFGKNENFVETIIENSIKAKGTFCVIIDGEISTNRNREIEFINENTRLLLFEKFNKNKNLHFKVHYNNEYIKSKKKSEFLKKISYKYDLNVITTVQQNRNLTTGEYQISNNELMYFSDLVLGVSKNENIFRIKVLKSRLSNNNMQINCILDENSHYLVTN